MIIHMQYNIHTHNSVYWDYTSSVTNYFPLNGLGGAVLWTLDVSQWLRGHQEQLQAWRRGQCSECS